VIMPPDYDEFDKSERMSKEGKQSSGSFVGWFKKCLSGFADAADDLTGDSQQAYCEEVRAQKRKQ
jgi:hypothetical protein